VYRLHVLVRAIGIQIGVAQHVFKMHTDVFVAHFFALVHGSNSEQAT